MKRSVLVGVYPFIRPYLPFDKDVAGRAQAHRDRMNLSGINKMQVIWCTQGVIEAERALLTLLHLNDLGAGTTYKRFGAYEVTNLFLGKHPMYPGYKDVCTANLVIDMTGFETANRKTEEFSITLMEAALATNASVTFTVSAADAQWPKIRNFCVAKGFVTYKAEPPTGSALLSAFTPPATVSIDATSSEPQRKGVWVQGAFIYDS